MLILAIVELPFAYYHGHLLEHRYGLSTQSRRHWFSDQAKGVALGLVLAMLGTSVVYVALREWPDDWWWISAGGVRGRDDRPGAARAGRAAADLLQVQAARSPALVERLVKLAARARTNVNRRVRVGAEQPHQEGQRGARRAGPHAAHPAVGHAARGLFRRRDRSDPRARARASRASRPVARHRRAGGGAVRRVLRGQSCCWRALADPLGLRGDVRSRRPAGVAADRRRLDVPADAGRQRHLARAGARRRPLRAEDDTQC